jgi:hypothetical protein
VASLGDVKRVDQLLSDQRLALRLCLTWCRFLVFNVFLCDVKRVDQSLSDQWLTSRLCFTWCRLSLFLASLEVSSALINHRLINGWHPGSVLHGVVFLCFWHLLVMSSALINRRLING